ncbi:unnamed protein product [Adineta steineri]|uniref:Uncharacterized protein n=1 Tax=Adineta steineri TaxID=433720 RepID=A0A815C4Z2_9BILA|nr:unnamed protein product [Adineta steineri]CAF3685896.1 unnamed protein product [Adineta steineri]
MNPLNRLNLLLSDILQNEPSSTIGISQESVNKTSSLMTFADHDYHSSPKLPSITASTSTLPLPPRRDSSLVKQHRQRHRIQQSDIQKQQTTQPLLNSSTLDDLFHALTLECEQYLADSLSSTYANKTYNEIIVQPPPPPPIIKQTKIDSTDDDYENLHSSSLSSSNGKTPLKTSIEVMSPEKRQVVSIHVSSKLSSNPLVTSSRTYPLLSSSCTTTTTTGNVPPIISHSSDDDDNNSINVSLTNTNRKRRCRRIRKQQIISSTIQSSSSSDERTEIINEKKAIISKRSCSTDHRQQRIKSIYDNQPLALPARRIRRRDISLQQNLPISTKHYEDISSRFVENLCSPLSVLLTSTRSTSDFVGRIQQQQQQPRRSRFEFINQQPITLLDRMHHQFYQPTSARHHHHNNNIPTHRIPSYPVY